MLRVLIVEDSEDDAQLILRQLRSGSYDPRWERVDTAADMTSSLDREQWDVILCDYKMPHFSAPAALKLIQDRKIDIPFIVVSGTIGEDTAIAAMKSGAHDYLMKNNLARLAVAIEREIHEASIRHEKKKAEEALRASEENYRRSLSDSPLGIRIVSADGKTLYANQAMLDIYGYDSMEELRTTPHKELYTPQSYAEHLVRKEQRQQGEYLPSNYEISIIRKDGEIRHLDVFRKEVLWNGEQQFQVLYSDITERKRAEEVILREKQFSDTVIDSMPGVFYLIDEKGRFVRLNKNMSKVTGYSSEELLRFKATDIIAEEYRALVASKIGAVFKKGYENVEAHLLTKDMRKIPYYFTGISEVIGDKTYLVGMGIDITERKRAEEALKKSEEYFKKITENSSDIIIITDKNGDITYCSRSVERFTGYKTEALIGKSAFVFIHPDDVQRAVSAFGKAILTKDAVSNAFRIVHKDGSVRFFDGLGRNLLDNPSVAGFIMNIRDVTEGKQAEETLRNEHMMLSRTEGIAQIGSWEWDVATDTVTWSDELFHIFQRDPREGAPSFAEHPAFYHPDDMARLQQAVAAAVADGTPYELELRAIRKDGETRMCVARGVPEMAPDGRAVRLFGSLQDITERKKAEEKLRFFALAVESSSDAIGMSTPDGKHYYQNKAFNNIFGNIGNDASASVFVDEQVGHEVFRTIMEGNQWTGEIKMRGKAGELVDVFLRAYAIKDDTERILGLVGVHTDITERKKTAEKLRESEEKMRSLLKASPDIIISIDREGKILFMNRTLVSTIEEVIGTSVFDHIPTEHRSLYAKTMENVFRTGQSDNFTTRGTGPGGQISWYEARFVGVESGDEIPSLMVVATDITESKKAEEELAFKNVILSTQQETSLDGILVVDDNSRIISYNQQFVDMWGIPFDVVESKSDERALQSVMDKLTNPEEFVRKVQHLYESRQETSREEIALKDGRTFDRYSAPMLGADGKYFGRVWYFRDITERKLAEEALRETEERYKSLFDHSLEAIYIADMNGNFTDANPYALKLLGYEKEEIASLNFLSLLDKESTEITAKISEEITKTGSQKEVAEYKVIKKDGTYVWVETEASLLYKNGEPVGIQGIARDVTERKIAEESLKKQAKLLMDTGEMAKVGGWELDLSTKEVTLTEEVSRIHGLKPGHKLKLEEALNFYAPESRPDVELIVKKAAETGESYDIESLFIPKGSKDKIWVRSLGKAVYSNGKIVKLAGTFQNINKYKKAEALLRESESKYRLLAENASDVITVMDMNLRPIYMSPSITRLLGYSVEESMARGIDGSLTPESVKVATKGFTATITKEKQGGELDPITIDLEFIRKDGSTVWVSASVNIIRGSDGQPAEILSILHDISERKRAEEDLIKHKDHLEELVKERTAQLDTAKVIAEEANKAKSDFLANMSHEIRTPLSTIIGFSELLSDETKGLINDDQKKYLGYVTSSGQHLLSLINDILDLSKVEAGKMELLPTSFSISDLLQTSLSFIAEKAMKHNIRLLSEISADVDVIEADERKVKQIMYNLLSNAVKFTPDGGSITIGTDVVSPHSAALPVKIRKGLPDTEYVLVRVKDTGIGIARKDQSKLFTEFQQIEEPYTKKYEGTGLGLALSKKLVTLHGGKIWCESKGKDKGCTFYFILPLKPLPNA